MDDLDQHIVAASENTEEFLEVPLGLILGTPVETVLERDVLAALRAPLSQPMTKAASRMTEKLALTGRMTSVIAHEINNPLEAIVNLLYLLSNHVEEDQTARAYIGMAESELQRISAITKQTLRWSKETTPKPG